MLFELPSDDRLYEALINRDPDYDGRAYVGVTTTGIFCRLTCPARKPKRENSQFFSTVASCMEAGFRPCKRCQPLARSGSAAPIVQSLTDALEENPSRRWSEDDIAALGFDPSTVRRVFKRHFDVTFLEMARLRRVQAGAAKLSMGGNVLDAQLEAGFESGSGFREAFARILGQSPVEMTVDGALRADWITTPLGPMIAVAEVDGLCLLEFADRRELSPELKRLRLSRGGIGVGRFPAIDGIESELVDYFAGTQLSFETPLAPLGTDFSRAVWNALRAIPPGETRSYGQIASAIGRPTASRAVARANATNPIAIVVPCHRVIGANGTLTGYAGGLWRKRWLIEHEQTAVTSDNC